MNREPVSWWSDHLQKDINLIVYGDGGYPVVVVQTQGSKCNNFEDFGMIDTLSDYLEEGIIQIRQERLLKMMQLGGVQRASDDLNRAMIRTVNEYRKHHEWRIQNRTQQLPDDDTKQLTAE